jgi:hypothetical protein
MIWITVINVKKFKKKYSNNLENFSNGTNNIVLKKKFLNYYKLLKIHL